jgi:hypothetical protein
MLSVGALAIVLFTLVSVDERVREQFSLRMADPSAQLASASTQVRDLTSVIVEAARDQSIEHAPLMIFVLAAVVLLLFMLRT